MTQGRKNTNENYYGAHVNKAFPHKHTDNHCVNNKILLSTQYLYGRMKPLQQPG